MPKVSDMISSKFLRKDDVGDDEVTVTIKDVALEEMPGDSGDTRWVLYFREMPKGMVLNATTIRVLDKSFGSHSDDWAGKKVTLYVDEGVQFKGQVVGGLRLRPVKGPKLPKTPLVEPGPAKPATEEGFNDEIPFNA
jgi:hypothetical protein